MSISFEREKDGSPAFKPLAGFNIVPVSDTELIARIEYFHDGEETEAGVRRALQMSLTPVQARALADALWQIADRVDAGTASSRIQ